MTRLTTWIFFSAGGALYSLFMESFSFEDWATAVYWCGAGLFCNWLSEKPWTLRRS